MKPTHLIRVTLAGIVLTTLAACGQQERKSDKRVLQRPAAPDYMQSKVADSGAEAAVERNGKCAFSAWVMDEDPAGTNVRAGPGNSYPILATLPKYRHIDAGLTGIEAVTFNVTEARNGWFRITNAELYPVEADRPGATYPSGWIYGGFVAFNLQTDYAFAEPDNRAPVVA